MIWIIDVIDALQLFCTLSRCFTWIILPVPECPVWPIVENRWTSPSLQSLPYNKHQIPYWVLTRHGGSDAGTVSLFFFITMAIWLAVLVWPIWRTSGCIAWGEIMMACLDKTHNQSGTIMQNFVCQSPSTGLNRWETSHMNQETIAC